MDTQQYLLGAAGVVLAALTVVLTMHYRRASPGRLMVSLNLGAAVNRDGIGTHLAVLVTISNDGQQPVYFGGLHALDARGEIYHPSCTIQGGTRLEPGQYMQGTIPAGHFLNTEVRTLSAVDGIGKTCAVPRLTLRRFLHELRDESQRLKALGFEQRAT